jgi:hypothetical protein
MIRLLRNLSSSNTVEIATNEARKLITSLERAGFSVSLVGSAKLERLVEELEKPTDKGRKLTSSEAKKIVDIMNVLEPMVHAEAHTKRVYTLSENRFNLDALLDKPEAMFSESVFERLPQIARQDITAAFQCLAFDQSTAVAFHILRACEAVLKSYYFRSVKRSRLSTPMWGNMLEALARRRGADEKLLSRLRFVKDSFRNPTSHPEATYTLHEAQDLIGICIDVVNRMAMSLPKTVTDVE